ncbi:MAG: 1-acyl-sn-glycerol-3-phosphate acyltransferase [Polyangiaceae bacterium]|nr:1-acyl-sn-glycerol-3-phosphate acyltransferase [Polyangiaceae bacterium]
MKEAVRSLFTAIEFGAVVTTMTPVMGLTWLRDRDDPTQRAPGRWMRRIGRTASRLSPLWDFDVDGTPPADIGHRPYVVIANHESVADPFLLSFLPWDMRWVAKEELFRMPLLGWTFRFSGDIPLRRGEGDSVRTMMTECRRALAAGISVMIFPEGKRSKAGTLLPFRDGAFSLAIEAGVPILPVVIAGTRDCLIDGPPWIMRARARARVLAPIETATMTTTDVPALRDHARTTIAAGLSTLLGDLEHAGARSPR